MCEGDLTLDENTRDEDLKEKGWNRDVLNRKKWRTKMHQNNVVGLGKDKVKGEDSKEHKFENAELN